MIEQISLSIPTPCSEKWDEFSVVKGGAFCGTCSKTIIDFTKMTDGEVVLFFTNKQLNTCGRFRHDQIKDYSKMTMQIKPGFPLFKAGMLCLTMLLLNKNNSAQASTVKAQTVFVQGENPTLKTNVPLVHDIVIKGVVKEKEGNEPLPGISIILKGSQEGTTTDADGKFTFPRKLKEGDVLVFSFIGYLTKEWVVTNHDIEDVAILMEIQMEMEMDMIVMGEVRVAEHPSHFSLRKLWVNIKSRF